MESTKTTEMARLLLAMREGHGSRPGGPHQLRTVANVAGVDYVDDSGSTFLDATLLSIMDIGKPLVWVVDASMACAVAGKMKEFLAEQVDSTVFYGEMERAMLQQLDAEDSGMYHAGDLRTAVFVARELAAEGGHVLFSPACPSGNGTANHAERGAEFKRAVLDL